MNEQEFDESYIERDIENEIKLLQIFRDQKHDAHFTLKGGVWKGARVLDAQEHIPH